METEQVEQEAPSPEIAERAAFAKELYGDRIPAPEVVEAPEQKADKPKEEDPWSGLPSAVRERIEGLTAKVQEFDKLSHRTNQVERRYEALLADLKKTKEVAQRAVAAPKAPTVEEIVAASKDEEVLKHLTEEWPEWGNAFAAQRAELKKQTATIEALKEELSGKSGQAEKKLAEKIEKLQEKLNFTAVKVDHNDLEEILDAEKGFKVFEPWRLKNQTENDDLNDPVSASRFVKRFKESDEYKTWAGIKPKLTAREIQEANQQRLRAAESTPGRQPPPTRTEADMTTSELRARAAAKLWPKQKG